MREKLLIFIVVVGLFISVSACGESSNTELFTGTMTDFQFSREMSIRDYFIEITNTEGVIMNFAVPRDAIDTGFTIGSKIQMNYYTSRQKVWEDKMWYIVKRLGVLEE